MRFLTKKIEEFTSDTIICFFWEDYKPKSNLFDYLNKLSNNQLLNQIETYKIFKGEFMETFKYSINENTKVLLTGLGKKDKLTRRKFSQVIANATRIAKNMTKNNSIGIELIENLNECINITKNFNKEDSAKITLCSARIGLYEFDKYLSEKKPKIETIEL